MAALSRADSRYVSDLQKLCDQARVLRETAEKICDELTERIDAARRLAGTERRSHPREFGSRSRKVMRS
jgi:hypothetical protein